MAKVVTATLADLKPDPGNARDHDERNIGAIVDALEKVGAARSIVIDENNVVMAGNGTVEAAAQVGIENVQIVEADGNTLVAVRRRGLTDDQKRRLALADNRTSELATWDREVLAGLRDDGDLPSGLWTDVELEDMLGASDHIVEGTATPVRVEHRPTEVVWLLLSIPLDKWTTLQSQIAALVADAEIGVQMTRPLDDAALKPQDR